MTMHVCAFTCAVHTYCTVRVCAFDVLGTHFLVAGVTVVKGILPKAEDLPQEDAITPDVTS